MEKAIGKEMPIEKKRDMLIELSALKLPQTYQDIVAAYGEEKGRKVYDDMFKANFKLTGCRIF